MKSDCLNNKFWTKRYNYLLIYTFFFINFFFQKLKIIFLIRKNYIFKQKKLFCIHNKIKIYGSLRHQKYYMINNLILNFLGYCIKYGKLNIK
jgi:hypothetical protein